MKKSVENLSFPLKGNYIAMLAPSFVIKFSYPKIITQLKELGFDKVVELTFGAKMINREYHKKLKNFKELLIASPCPGVVEAIKSKVPKYEKCLARIDSPMVATAKICKKVYPNHKTVFISPCYYKKIEASKSEDVDFVIDYAELNKLFVKFKILNNKKKIYFDRFYNNYTKIYPIAGGLGKTAHLMGVIDKNEIKTIDGITDIIKFLNKPDEEIRFLDALFCKGGCIGGPCIISPLSLRERKKKVLEYLKNFKKEDIPEARKGLMDKAKGINFSGKCWFD